VTPGEGRLSGGSDTPPHRTALLPELGRQRGSRHRPAELFRPLLI